MKNFQTGEGYGKSLDNPILLNSINSTMRYIENLVTADHGYHLIAHRAGSIPHKKRILDAYEIYTTDGNYDCLYVSIYEKINLFLPPPGYLFEFPFVDEEVSDKSNFYSENENEATDTDLPVLEKHLLFSKATNFRIGGFPKNLIRQLFEEGALVGVSNLPSLLKTIKSPL